MAVSRFPKKGRSTDPPYARYHAAAERVHSRLSYAASRKVIAEAASAAKNADTAHRESPQADIHLAA